MRLKLCHQNSQQEIKFKNDLDRPVITQNCLERDWIELTEEDDEWEFNFYWIAVTKIKALFNPRLKIRLRNDQVVNHFPNHFELTRKDLLIKNMKRFKPMQKQIEMIDRSVMELSQNTLPVSYILPLENSLFLEEFQRIGDQKWIFKPANSSQGKGIQIVSKPQQLKLIQQQMGQQTSNQFKQQIYVICKYIDNPLLIEGKKFDLRTYVLVTSYKPLIVWRYRDGFARFCFENYNGGQGQDQDNQLYGHLTNVSFQKYSSKYNEIHGGKWSLKSFFGYFERVYGKAKFAKLKQDIDQIYLSSLKAVQNVIIND